MVASLQRPMCLPELDTENAAVPRWLQSIAEANQLNKAPAGDSDLLNSLVLRLSHANSSVRLLAAKCLATKAVKGDERVLVALLNLAPGTERRGADDAHQDVRVASIDSAGVIAEGTKSLRVSERLVSLLEDRDWIVRQAAVRALGRVGCTDDSALLDELCSLMQNDKVWTKAMAAEALGVMCIHANERIVGSLVAVMEDPDWAVRKTATKALGGIVTTDPGAIRAVMRRMRDCDWRVRKAAVETAASIYTPGSDDLLDAILARVEDEDVQNTSKETLDVLSKGDKDVKTAAILCLAELACKHREQRVQASLRGVQLQLAVSDEAVRARVNQALETFCESG